MSEWKFELGEVVDLKVGFGRGQILARCQYEEIGLTGAVEIYHVRTAGGDIRKCHVEELEKKPKPQKLAQKLADHPKGWKESKP